MGHRTQYTDAVGHALGVLLCAVFVGATRCTGENELDPVRPLSEAITHGVLDMGDPAVARIEGGLSPCTGTLISAAVVLTAAHCLEFPPTAVVFGADSAQAEDRFAVKALSVHPDFDPILIDNDVALLLLEHEPDVEPNPWLGEASMEPLLGAEVRLVGYGLTVSDESQSEIEAKRTGTARVSAVTDRDDLQFGRGDTCCRGLLRAEPRVYRTCPRCSQGRSP